MSSERVDYPAFAGIESPHPACLWSGLDRLGNAILITRGAFGILNRQHVWQRHGHDPHGNSSKWDLLADNWGEIAGAGAIWHRFKCAAPERNICSPLKH